jgi:hypothetical protein
MRKIVIGGFGAALISYGQQVGDEADVTVIPDELPEVDRATAADARR